MVNADETSQTTLYGLFPTIRPVALFYACVSPGFRKQLTLSALLHNKENTP